MKMPSLPLVAATGLLLVMQFSGSPVMPLLLCDPLYAQTPPASAADPAARAVITDQVNQPVQSQPAQPNQPQPTDWPQWRGPNRDGILKNTTAWPKTLSKNRLTETWRVGLGDSYSGPLVVGDRVFVTETVNKQEEHVRCLSRSSGQEIWKAGWRGSMRVPFFAASNGSWIRATPAYADGRVFVAGIRDVLVCLNAETGAELWRRDFPAELGSTAPQFGCVCSPLVDGQFVYMQAGGAMHKIESSTGKTIWQACRDGAGQNSSVFSSPAIETVAGVRQLIVQGRTELAGVDIDAGTKLWSTQVPAFRGMSILTPTVFKDQIFISNYQHPSMMLAVGQSGSSFSVSEKWKLKLRGYMTTPVVIDGHAYTFLQNQRFACVDLNTGQQKWVSRKFGKYASLVANGDQILALTSDGQLILFKTDTAKFDLVDQRAVGTNAWAHLAVSGEDVFVRNLDALIVLKWK